MYNKMIAVGNLTKDIEFKTLPSGSALAKGSIATSHKYKAQDGTQKEEVCFLDFTIFGRTAEVANQYLRKGSKVMLEGRLALDEWTGTDGQKRTKHSLVVAEMKMLGSKNDSYQGQDEPTQLQKREPNIPMQTEAPKMRQVPDIELDYDEIQF